MKITLLNPSPNVGTPDERNPPMTISDLADELGKSERTIRRWISDYGIEPAAKIGREYAYWLSDMLTLERDTRKNRQRGLVHAQSSRVA